MEAEAGEGDGEGPANDGFVYTYARVMRNMEGLLMGLDQIVTKVPASWDSLGSNLRLGERKRGCCRCQVVT